MEKLEKINDWNRSLPELYQLLASGGAQKWVDEKAIEIKSAKLYWLLLNASCWLLVLTLFFWNPSDEKWHEWFSRLGSIICLMSALIEYYFLSKFSDIVHVNEDAYPLSCDIYIQRKYKSFVKYSKRYTLAVIILGTIIWGYGDLIFFNFMM